MALGLALQGLDRAAVTISLCPEVIRWTRTRQQRFGYLVAAVHTIMDEVPAENILAMADAVKEFGRG